MGFTRSGPVAVQPAGQNEGPTRILSALPLLRTGEGRAGAAPRSAATAAAAAARDEQVRGVDVPLGNRRVHARVQIVEVVTRVAVVDQIAELLAITRATARVDVEDDVVAGRPELLHEVKAVAVVREGPAVDLEDQGVFPF